MIVDICVPATQFMGETKEREDGEKVLSPKSHESEIKALSQDMENKHPREVSSLRHQL